MCFAKLLLFFIMSINFVREGLVGWAVVGEKASRAPKHVKINFSFAPG